MKSGALIGYKKDGSTALILAGSNIKEQRSTFQTLTQAARANKGDFESVEWFIGATKATKKRKQAPVLNVVAQAPTATSEDE